MASAWGTSFGSAWGNSWGFLASVVLAGGTSKRRKTLTLPKRWSDEPLLPVRPEVFVSPAVQVRTQTTITVPTPPLEAKLYEALEARAKRESRARKIATMVLSVMDDD